MPEKSADVIDSIEYISSCTYMETTSQPRLSVTVMDY